MSKRSYNLTRTTYDNADVVLSPEGKKRRSQTDLDCILDAGRLIICGGKQLATMTEDRLFVSSLVVARLLHFLSGIF